MPPCVPACYVTMSVPKEVSCLNTVSAEHLGISTVSVVITSYNHGRFLAEAIETVRAQTRRATEVIVVDDGSTDNTHAVASRYDDIIYLWQENSGLAAARNAGLRSSTSDCIVFLDADDRLRPNALESGLQCLRTHPNSFFTIGGYRTISADGTPVREFDPPKELTYESLLACNGIAMNAAVMFRRSALEAIGGFDSTLRSCEDYDLYLRLARTYDSCMNAEIVAEYRRHASNMSNDVPLMLRGALLALRKQADCLRASAHSLDVYKRGRHTWKKYYSHIAVCQIGKAIKSGYYSKAVRTSAAMWRLAPATFTEAFAAGALRTIRAAAATEPEP